METLFASIEDRTVRGLLLPWGELSRAATDGAGGRVEPILFQRGDCEVPSDCSVIGANVAHNREDPRGRAVQLEDTEAGIVATFSIAKTPEGDALLADVVANKLTRLSPEIKGIRRHLTDKTRAISGKLFGAAFVTEGAFASAALYAELLDEESESHSTEEFTDENGVTWVRKYDTKTTTDVSGDTTTRTTVSSVTEEKKTEAPAEEPTTEEITMDAALAPIAATVPQTLMAGAAPATNQAATRFVVAQALAAYFKSGDLGGIAALSEHDRNAGDTLFAALSDIKATSAGAAGLAIIQPQWVGDVWAARTRPRKITPLIGPAPLTSYKVAGFTFGTKPVGGDWAGDKAAIPSGPITTIAVTQTADRWAGGHDIAREFVDFDVPEFWLGYFQYMTNDYVKWDDAKTLAYLIAGATAVVGGAVPVGVNAATALLIDGALKVVSSEEASPSFAVVGTDVYRSLLLQGKDDIIATLSLALDLEEGSLSGFRILPSAAVALTGKALVGARESATHYELGGAPIRTEALDMVKGGVDHAFFGYSTTVINNTLALALVSSPV